MSFFDDASLAFLPSGAAGKDGKAYSIKPTDGTGDFAFSRGSNLAATRVGADGLIEKGRENLLLQSNNFDTTPWSEINTTLTSGQSGYDGSNDSWLLEAASDGPSRYVSQSVSSSGVNTFSCYAKAGTTHYIRIQINAGSTSLVYFDLTAGVADSTLNEITTNIEAVSGATGWYRCSLVANNSSISSIRIYVARENSVNVITGDNVYIQDAQLEIGLVATEVIESGASTGKAGLLEDEPRFDYSGDCPSLLLEPSRTNLVEYSEYAGSWSTSGTGLVTDNDETSPEGLQNAFTLNDTSSGAYYRIERNVSVSAGDNTLSVFLKKTTGALSHYAGVQLDSSRKYVIIDTTNGTWNEDGANPTNDFIDVEDFSADYWRVIIRNNLTAGSKRVALWPALSTNGSVIAVGATGANTFYGVQLEQGSYPTSYIPNYSGGTITREYDGSYILSMQSNNIVGATDSYTIFFDISNDDGGNTAGLGNSQWLKAQDSPSYSNIWTLRKQDVTDQKYHSLYYNKDSTYLFNNETINKGCFVCTTNEIKVFLDGSLNTTYSVTNSPLNLNGFRIDYGSSDRTTIEFSQLLIFPTALSDADCITLTT